MKKVLEYILSSVFYLIFGVATLIFHPIQIMAYFIGGRKLQMKALNGLLFFISQTIRVAGVKLKYINFDNLPNNRPIIIVANHHDTQDITNLNWILRKKDVSFVSKARLGKGIPSISYNLRKSSSALIDRKDRRQSISEILRLAKHIEENNSTTVIFPEGTRKHYGDLLRTFKTGGVSALIKKAPSAIVIPVAISNTWKLKFPFPLGTTLTFERLEGIEPKDFENAEEVIKECERKIHKAVKINE